MLDRVTFLKTTLWAIVGAAAAVAAARVFNGLGAATALSDTSPWGIWIAFDVMAGVALAAGGFVIAATVYIFGLEKYRPFARPAILTAFLGYIAVAVGLLFDLGLPWNIWHPMIFWQHHSVLFEVAMCVMLYLTVLGLEFAPVALEHPLFSHPLFKAIHAILKKITILLVIAGIVLSTLHQSSLGSLFLITSARLHPLWYSPYIYILFFISAIALGLMVVAMESLLSAYFFRHKLRMDLLSRLGVAAACVLAFYGCARLLDIALQGKLGLVFDGSWQSALFRFELLISAFLPALLLAIPKIRQSVAGLTACSALTIFGMVLYRFDVCLVAFARPDDMPYFPSWMEIAISGGVVSGATLVFIFFIENLKVYGDDSHDEAPAVDDDIYSPTATHYLAPMSLLAPRRFSFAFVAGAAVSVALLPATALFGTDPARTPVDAPRTVNGWMVETAVGHDFVVDAKQVSDDAKAVAFLRIDGDRNGNSVLFPHDFHVDKLEGENSCATCHHMNAPFDANTSCHECHADMYETTDIFNHASHTGALGGNASCHKCHADRSDIKSRDTAKACAECHTDMIVEQSVVKPRKGGLLGFAPGYQRVMHDEFAEEGFCISCHKEKAEEEGREAKGDDHALTRCDACHRDIDGSDLRTMAPYVSRATEK